MPTQAITKFEWRQKMKKRHHSSPKGELIATRCPSDSNARATYQKLVNKLFKQQIGRNVEVYVDNMLVKSQAIQDHVQDLAETFDVLRRHNMKLNFSKCASGVLKEKFLGFMIT